MRILSCNLNKTIQFIYNLFLQQGLSVMKI